MDRRCCEPLRVARGGSCVEVTVDEGRLLAERTAIRSGCIPAGGRVGIEMLSERDMDANWTGVLDWSLGERVTTGGSGSVIAGLDPFVSN